MIDAKAFVSQLHTLGGGIYNAASMALRSAVQAAEADAKGTTLYNDRTGLLRSKTTGSVNGLSGEIRAATPYAKWVENGTRPHKITARKGGVLCFVSGGATRFARSVNHPGTAERPFMQHAKDVGEKTLDYGADYFLDYATNAFNRMT